MDQYALNLYPQLAEAKLNVQKAVINLKQWKIGTEVRSNEEAYGRLVPTTMAIESVVKQIKKTVKASAALLGDSKQTIEIIDSIKNTADELAMIALDLEATAEICIRRLTFQGIEYSCETGEEEEEQDGNS